MLLLNTSNYQNQFNMSYNKGYKHPRLRDIGTSILVFTIVVGGIFIFKTISENWETIVSFVKGLF